MRGKPRCSGRGSRARTAKLSLTRREHNAPPQSFLRTDGYLFWRIILLDTPLRLLTRTETTIFRVVVHKQMDMVFVAIKLHQFSFKVVTDTGKDAPRSPSTSLVKTSGLYFVTKTKCTCIRNTQCLPCSNTVSIVAFLHRPRLYSQQCYRKTALVGIPFLWGGEDVNLQSSL